MAGSSGAVDTLVAAGRPLPPERLFEALYDLDAAADAARALLTRHPRPTALICGNDVLAAGALRGAKDLGLKVPEDVSVVGYDDIDLAVAVDPPLTTVRVPHRRMGRAAAALLLQMIDGGAPDSLRFDFEIIERESLSRLRQSMK